MIVLCGAVVAVVTYIISEVTVTLFSLSIALGISLSDVCIAIILLSDVCTAIILLVVFAIFAQAIAKGH